MNPQQQKVRAREYATGDTGGCFHIRAFRGKRDYYCPDCYLRGELYEKNGKRMFRRWRGVCH